MADVTFKSVKKIYDGAVTAVSKFSLSISDKEFVVFVGPSGCGKSTVLRMVAGLEDITEGDLHIGGSRMNDLSPKDRDIAMVFQNYALYPHMSVYDNMAFGLVLRKYPKKEIEARVRETAETLGLTPYLERKPKALSGGQRQRVALGRAIVRRPKVFLFDEPLSNLDAKMRVQMRKEICLLHKRLSATMIYVTHDQVEAMTMGDRIVVMENGQIQQIGSPMEIYRSPANKFVAGFIGSPPMNFIDYVVSGTSMKNGDVTIPIPEHLRSQLSKLDGKSVCLGIRPEDLQMSATPDSIELPGSVDLCEPLGSEVLLYVATCGASIIAKILNGSPSKVGDTITLYAPYSALHLFDGATGAALTRA